MSRIDWPIASADEDVSMPEPSFWVPIFELDDLSAHCSAHRTFTQRGRKLLYFVCPELLKNSHSDLTLTLGAISENRDMAVAPMSRHHWNVICANKIAIDFAFKILKSKFETPTTEPQSWTTHFRPLLSLQPCHPSAMSFEYPRRH